MHTQVHTHTHTHAHTHTHTHTQIHTHTHTHTHTHRHTHTHTHLHRNNFFKKPGTYFDIKIILEHSNFKIFLGLIYMTPTVRCYVAELSLVATVHPSPSNLVT